MTPLLRLYEAADTQGLTVVAFPMRHLTAIALPDGVIGLNPDKVDTTAGETVCLAHEMGHCLTGTFYSADDDVYRKGRCEQRADRWAMERLVPLGELKAALRRGVSRPYELAEHFGVTEEFVCKCLEYYHEAKGAL